MVPEDSFHAISLQVYPIVHVLDCSFLLSIRISFHFDWVLVREWDLIFSLSPCIFLSGQVLSFFFFFLYLCLFSVLVISLDVIYLGLSFYVLGSPLRMVSKSIKEEMHIFNKCLR